MKLVLVLFVLLLSSFCEFTKAVCLKISPTRLVVKYGDPASANCTPDTPQTLAWEATQGGVSLTSDKVQFLEWTVNSVADWTIAPICNTDGGVCAETLNITVYELPSMVSISGPSDQMVAGRQSEFRCRIQNVFPVNRLHVSFYKVSINNIKTEITSYPPEMNIPIKPSSKAYTLQFTPSRGDHGAQLWCSARLELGEEGPKPPRETESQHLPLNVFYKPNISETSEPRLEFTEGDILSLSCRANGNPAPSYQWAFPVAGPVLNNTKEGSVLTITNIARSQAGEYTCIASNLLGNSTRSVEVKVTGSSQATRSVLAAVLLIQLIHWL